MQNGDPEVVFIKRAAREGDRWTSHVALPGGKRDAEDESDRDVAVRETMEEIGLDLTSENAFYVGNLPERVVSTSWVRDLFLAITSISQHHLREKDNNMWFGRGKLSASEFSSFFRLVKGRRSPWDLDKYSILVQLRSFRQFRNIISRYAATNSKQGKVPIMVLCPYVFLWIQPELPPLKLSPGEVASTHWVPLRVLLSPSSRTHEHVDVSDRFARQGGVVVKTALRSILGLMQFSAIKLVPSESLYCTSTAEFFSPPEAGPQAGLSIKDRLYRWYRGDHAGSSDSTRPLLLWGLTLGMLADFLDQLPPHNSVQLWSYPTFTSLDVRWIINILTFSLKRRNRALLQQGAIQNQTAVDTDTEAVATGDNPWFIGGLSNGMKQWGKGSNATKSYAVGIMLDGYYDRARAGVWLAVAGRTIATITLGLYIMRRYKMNVR